MTTRKKCGRFFNCFLFTLARRPLVYLFALSYRYILVERHQHAHNTAVPSLELNFEYP